MQRKDRQQRRAKWLGPAEGHRWSERVMARKEIGRAEGMEDFGESDALHALGDSSGTRPCAAVIHVTTSGMDLYLTFFSQSLRV
jgi:hypothetical protein